MISDGSDVEEVAPPPIAHHPVTSTDEATISTSASLSSARNTLSFILNEENISPAPIRPAEVTGLSLHPPPNEVTGPSPHPHRLPPAAIEEARARV